MIPRATYTDPEVARVGLNEKEARAKGISYELTRYGIDAVLRIGLEPGNFRLDVVARAGERAARNLRLLRDVLALGDLP